MLAEKTHRQQPQADQCTADNRASIHSVLEDFRRSVPQFSEQSPKWQMASSTGSPADVNIPAVRQLQTAGSGAPTDFAMPIQRKVSEIEEDGVKYFCTDADESIRFDTYEEAELYENFVLNKGRPPTLYTYTHTKSTSKVSPLGISQGPHTIGFAAVSAGFEQALLHQKLMGIFQEQCPPPKEWKSIIEEEKGVGMLENQCEYSKRLRRAYQEYSVIYEKALEAIKAENVQLAKFYISRLIQLHPFATYGWKSISPASKKSLKGKGESTDMQDDGNVDRGGKWKMETDFQSFIDNRRLLLDDDFVMEDEESENDFGLSSDYEEDDGVDYDVVE